MKAIFGFILSGLILFPTVMGESNFYCGYIREIDAKECRIAIEEAIPSGENPPTGKIVSFYISENTLITSLEQSEEEFIESIKIAAEGSKEEVLQLALETLAPSDKVIFSFDAGTMQLITVRKVPEDVNITIGPDSVSFAKFVSSNTTKSSKNGGEGC